jgi:hypothetical protein
LRAARFVLLAAFGPIAAAACGGASEGGARAPVASASASVTSSASASALPAATATAVAATPAASAGAATDWLKSVPSRPGSAKVNDLVWAAVPTNADVRVGIYRVVQVTGTTAALQDILRVRWEKVPGALLLPVGDPFRLKQDMLVTYADWRGYVGVGMIVRTQPKIRVTFRDAASVVREETVYVAEPLVGSISALQFVSFTRGGADHKGLVFLVDGDNIFIRDESGHAVVVDRAQVKTLKVPAKKLKVGDAVRAYSLDKGYRPGVVAKIFLPGLSYDVTAGEETHQYFFSDLALPQ